MTRRTKLILLAAIGILLMSAASAAAVEFIWKVQEAKLEPEQKESMNVISTVTPFKLSGNSIGGATEIECKNLSAEGANLVGGKPGELDGAFTLTECSPKKPATCTEVYTGDQPNGTLLTSLDGEIVESELGEKKMLLVTVRIPFKMRGTKCPSIICEEISGEILVEVTPEDEENATKKLIFQGAKVGYRKDGGALQTAFLDFRNGEQAFMQGEVEIGPTAKVKFGAF
jgi:hypothetical protein